MSSQFNAALHHKVSALGPWPLPDGRGSETVALILKELLSRERQ